VSEDESIERLSVGEAAERLGVTRDAIHKRITRGSIQHDKGADGRFYVYVDTSTTMLDTSTDTSNIESTVEVLREMIASQERMMELTQERIAFLEQELERRGAAEERLHRIVVGLTQTAAQLSSRVPELEAPAQDTGEREDAPESPPSPGPTPTPAPTGAEREMVTEMPTGPTPSEASEAVQTGTEPRRERSWWQRMFGG
jgi:DNA-binding transcriptional MerR regulator